VQVFKGDSPKSSCIIRLANMVQREELLEQVRVYVCLGLGVGLVSECGCGGGVGMVVGCGVLVLSVQLHGR